MQLPLEVTYRNVPKTDLLENLIQEKSAKLDKVCEHLVSCRVAVESPQKHQQSGRPHRVRIVMRVPPGHELVVTRESTQGNIHEPLDAVVRDAFDAARIQLKELVEKQRGEVKVHPEQEDLAFVTRLVPEEDYGFMRTPDGTEIYFHRNSVLNDEYDRLDVGTGVRFVMEMGEEGLQASTVQIMDKPSSG